MPEVLGFHERAQRVDGGGVAFQSLNRPVTSCVPLEPLFLDFVTFLSGGSALTSWLPQFVVDCVTCLMVVPSLVPVNQVLRFHL